MLFKRKYISIPVGKKNPDYPDLAPSVARIHCLYEDPRQQALAQKVMVLRNFNLSLFDDWLDGFEEGDVKQALLDWRIALTDMSIREMRSTILYLDKARDFYILAKQVTPHVKSSLAFKKSQRLKAQKPRTSEFVRCIQYAMRLSKFEGETLKTFLINIQSSGSADIKCKYDKSGRYKFTVVTIDGEELRTVASDTLRAWWSKVRVQ